MSDLNVPVQHLTQADLAERWQVSPRTLERWRAEQSGPRWVVLRGSVRYRLVEIQKFVARNLCGPTDHEAPSSDGGAT